MDRESLRRYRVMRGLTQKDLAEKIGIAQSYYSVIESGKKKLTSKMKERVKEAIKIKIL
ncbi:helix-turn-helix transcriptional regulator [Cytobacillus kochii]|uniref:helix-turn-helix domain-containing protein n=1 Tax=Cytobacillus kochii TaxID=859143 RepID=UPI001CD3837C|nr:helix-turn-helix transcriptional regulator [Cytobacillus kochii]MCA1027319.1 helix-turn-helix transcriptional regulator [Cytobacillus kochii]